MNAQNDWHEQTIRSIYRTSLDSIFNCSFRFVELGLMIRKMMMESLVDHETHNKLQLNAAYNKHKRKSMK